VYDCRWGTDTIRVVVVAELPQEAHNAPLHLFSAAPDLVEFGGRSYERRSEQTSRLLNQLFEMLRGEGFAMSYTMEDFNREYNRKLFLKLTKLTPEERREALESLAPDERQEVLQSLPVGELLTLLSAEQVKQLRDQLLAGPVPQSRKSRRKR
jgi:hypothetical protein